MLLLCFTYDYTLTVSEYIRHGSLPTVARFGKAFPRLHLLPLARCQQDILLKQLALRHAIRIGYLELVQLR